jgi:type II restriction/modification system DNA methylase subunit YeeA
MNTAQLKSYAPAARREFIAAVTAQAARLGITAKGAEPAKVDGDVFLVGGHAYPTRLVDPHRRLVERVKKAGFAATMEAIAYTWFNRLVALRYMELHGFLDHGYRVLSHPDGNGRPEILDHAAELDLPGLDREKVVELKLDGTKDEALYRIVLIAQCNALHRAMPFLFDPVGHETEMLLPAGLLQTDSLIRKLVESVDESAWEEIEIIGWLYQYYISEKKDEVIGNVVKSEDIPAATQLFTPNWIVKYMVQNTLGAQWLATYPNSPLKAQMEFYIEPAEQTHEVKEQLAAITRSDLNPEELTLIDPACGSGHILVEAYDLFKAIYLERGYRQRDVPKLILEKNLSGLDIDERAAQLAGFSLIMKAREDDRRLLEGAVKLNVVAFADSTEFEPQILGEGLALADYGIAHGDLATLKTLFENATSFGSLIQIPEALKVRFEALRGLSEAASENMFVNAAQRQLRGLLQQAEKLAGTYDTVVANPPYMGSKSMNSSLKRFAKETFPQSKSDLFAVSTERFLELAKPTGFIGLMTPFTWMFLSSYEAVRAALLDRKTVHSLIQPEYHAFFDSAYVPVCSFVAQNSHTPGYNAAFIKLADFYGAELQAEKTLEAIRNPNCGWFYRTKPDALKKIPGRPVAYWVSDGVRAAFESGRPLKEIGDTRQGMATSDNARFLRMWPEVAWQSFCSKALNRQAARSSGATWFPYNKGGEFRKFYGNCDFVVNWRNDGEELLAHASSLYGSPTRTIKSISEYFKPSISWSKISSGWLAMRAYPPGFLFDVAGCSIFSDEADVRDWLLGFANSTACRCLLSAISPTLNFEAGQVAQLPIVRTSEGCREEIVRNVRQLVSLAATDWNICEHSWEFQGFPLTKLVSRNGPTLESSYEAWRAECRETVARAKQLEERNNHLFIDAYGLADELTSEVSVEQITLTVNPAYRYGGKLTEEELRSRFRQDTMKELVSYAIGCMMGRYSLDAPGLIYAHSGNEGFEHGHYRRFPADDDGIIPVTDTHWFDDDVCHRLVEFISVAWDKSHLEENLTFLAANLLPKKNESSRDTIRRYLSDSLFADHLQTYKKRPIYWLFSSGKQKAIQCLVYLHRYNEGTLARMRSEYVIPLQGKMAARLEQLQGDIQGATSTAHQKRLEKEQAKLKKQQIELLAFDEKLRHYADKRICLDLDDGVKVNYGKFGDLLADVKAVHGKKPEVA